jgi:putative endonuclease
VRYPPRRKRTENPCVGGSMLHHDRTFVIPPFFMFAVYILYSPSSSKTYTGFTNNIQRRLLEHNEIESKGFTLRYRPWVLIHTEEYSTKQEAMMREKFLKTGVGRKFIKTLVSAYLHDL